MVRNGGEFETWRGGIRKKDNRVQRKRKGL